MFTRSNPRAGASGGWRRPRPGAIAFGLWLTLTAAALPAISAVAGRWADPVRTTPEALRRFPNLVMLDIDPVLLKELYANSRLRGREWERPGHVSFFSNGALRFETSAGVRIHGGVSRFASTKQQSFRLLFRGSLESTSAPGQAIGFALPREHEILVLHGDERNKPDGSGDEWRYVNPFAYDIARELGVLTAQTVPTTLVVNGGPPRPYVLTEYLDVDYLEARFGHRNFEVFGYRGGEGTPKAGEGPVAQLDARFGDRKNWTLENVSRVVDVDNLSRWFLTVLFCGSRDFFQGKLVRDLQKPDAKWFWVAWDFDNSFGREDPPTAPFGRDQWSEILESNRNDPRVIVLQHLFKTSDEFRRSFARLFVTARDSILTPAFVDRALIKYEQAAALNDVTDIAYQGRIREYMAKRPAVVREQLIRYLHVDIP